MTRLHVIWLLPISCTSMVASSHTPKQKAERIVTGLLVGTVRADREQLTVAYQVYQPPATKGSPGKLSFPTTTLSFFSSQQAEAIAAQNKKARHMTEGYCNGTITTIDDSQIAQILQGNLTDTECRHTLYKHQCDRGT